ncbi:hypothetical protein HED60_10345 [Planctomycetales bacterium ZRK34]|nr:hypothetical protein HED60_10345 [Planctomycetales bacterium ZRK34]
MSEYDWGLLIGLLIGEGHFGGDGRQPQITLRMHTRHKVLFDWIVNTFPGGRLYGPYNHCNRSYYQWMIRGRTLREIYLPILDIRITPTVDEHVYSRYAAMKERYPKQLGQPDRS